MKTADRIDLAVKLYETKIDGKRLITKKQLREILSIKSPFPKKKEK